MWRINFDRIMNSIFQCFFFFAFSSDISFDTYQPKKKKNSRENQCAQCARWPNHNFMLMLSFFFHRMFSECALKRTMCIFMVIPIKPMSSQCEIYTLLYLHIVFLFWANHFNTPLFDRMIFEPSIQANKRRKPTKKMKHFIFIYTFAICISFRFLSIILSFFLFFSFHSAEISSEIIYFLIFFSSIESTF